MRLWSCEAKNCKRMRAGVGFSASEKPWGMVVDPVAWVRLMWVMLVESEAGRLQSSRLARQRLLSLEYAHWWQAMAAHPAREQWVGICRVMEERLGARHLHHRFGLVVLLSS